uniref:Uncharacterized protein n=1 Tax=Anguilla anguilla TaxID=7936 RepID=A0A0E9UJI1_ANGAN
MFDYQKSKYSGVAFV